MWKTLSGLQASNFDFVKHVFKDRTMTVADAVALGVRFSDFEKTGIGLKDFAKLILDKKITVPDAVALGMKFVDLEKVGIDLKALGLETINQVIAARWVQHSRGGRGCQGYRGWGYRRHSDTRRSNTTILVGKR